MRLVLAFTDTQTDKRQRAEDDKSTILGSSETALPSDRVSGSKLLPLSRGDYPLVNYWEKKVWKIVAGNKKDTSDIQTKGSSRGGTRASKGENVMMLYIEDATGSPIDGNIASGMRDFARCIWRSLYERGIAPETWGQATKEVRDEYSREMESEYPVLQLCDNHWKSHALATAIYSQWYRTYDMKMKPCTDHGGGSDGDDTDNNSGGGSDGPPRKKLRATTVEDDDSHSTVPMPEPEQRVDNEGMVQLVLNVFSS